MVTWILIITTLLWYVVLTLPILSQEKHRPLLVFTVVWAIAKFGYLMIDQVPGYETYQPTLNSALLLDMVHFVYYVSWIISGAVYSTIFRSRFSKNDAYYVELKYKGLFYLFLFIGFIGFCNNLLNVLNAGGLAIYFTLPLREVELVFGSSRIFNYLYFCNIVALLILPKVFHQGEIKTSHYFLFIAYFLLVLSMHGVKGTVIFSFAGFYFSTVLVKKNWSTNLLMGTVSVSLLFFAIVTVVRIFGVDTDDNDGFDLLTSISFVFVRYLSTGQVNLLLEIERSGLFSIGHETFASLSEVTCYFANSGCSRGFAEQESLALWNEAYNTGTFAREYVRDFGVLGMFFALIFQAVIFSGLNNFAGRKHNLGFVLQAVVLLMHFGVFFSNHFLKLQYLFIIFVVMVSSLCLKQEQKKPMLSGEKTT